MQPPHTRDLLSQDDRNYSTQAPLNREKEEAQESDFMSENPMDIADECQVSEGTGGHTPAAHHEQSQSTASGPPAYTKKVTRNVQQRTAIPPGMIPHVISSSDTSECNVNRRVGNTTIRRKSFSGHSLIAEAIRATGDVMARQMREMADASRDLERSKIDV